MKRLITLLIVPFIMLSCKQLGGDQKSQHLPKSSTGPDVLVMVSEFPASRLDELVESISQEDLIALTDKGESGNWRRTTLDINRGEMVIQNKLSKDNSVRFVQYGGSGNYSMLAIQQVNAQVSVTKVWKFIHEVDKQHPERWDQYLLPNHRLPAFFDENVILPGPYVAQDAKPYVDYILEPYKITMRFNTWTYMRELEADSVAPEGPLNPALVKYKYVLEWNNTHFNEEKVIEAGYEDVHMFMSKLVEPAQGGPGPHEFDCGHGVSVKTSSFLAKQGSFSYSASNMTDGGDGSDGTAWAEGVEGDGVGEWIEFTITSNFRIGDAWQIGNGYMRNKETFTQNGKVKKLKVLIDDKPAGYVMLANVSVYQSFSIAPSWLKDSFDFTKGTRIRFIIEEVYQGSKYDDTLISYFMPVGNCG